MEKLKASLLIIIFVLSGLSQARAQKTDKKDEQFKEMAALIESGRYMFTVHSVQPSGSGTINVSAGYTLEAKDSIFIAQLPYFGRAYSASYGGDGGIVFEASPEHLNITLNEKKRMVNVKFEIRGKNDKYDLYLSTGSSGYASLSINSQNRQPVTYSGIVSPLREDENVKEGDNVKEE